MTLLKVGSEGARGYALWSLSLSINEENQKVLLDEAACARESLAVVAVRPGVTYGDIDKMCFCLFLWARHMTTKK
mgnify:CR=1 FL=1